MDLEKRISNFELQASQLVSNALKKVVIFRQAQSLKLPYVEVVKKLREGSFYIILQSHIEEKLLIGLDKAIIDSWIDEQAKEINLEQFDKLKKSTAVLCEQIIKCFSAIDYTNWNIIRYEIHPNFLAVIPAHQDVDFHEINIHIGRTTGKLAIIKYFNTKEL